MSVELAVAVDKEIVGNDREAPLIWDFLESRKALSCALLAARRASAADWASAFDLGDVEKNDAILLALTAVVLTRLLVFSSFGEKEGHGVGGELSLKGFDNRRGMIKNGWLRRSLYPSWGLVLQKSMRICERASEASKVDLRTVTREVWQCCRSPTAVLECLHNNDFCLAVKVSKQSHEACHRGRGGRCEQPKIVFGYDDRQNGCLLTGAVRSRGGGSERAVKLGVVGCLCVPCSKADRPLGDTSSVRRVPRHPRSAIRNCDKEARCSRSVAE